MNSPQFMDESRFFENEWEGENDLGFEIYEFPMVELPKVIKEIQALQSSKEYEGKYDVSDKAHSRKCPTLRFTTATGTR